MPLRLAVPSVAWALTQVRLASAESASSARPRSAPARSKPTPPMPTWPPASCRPMASSCASTTLPSASTTDSLRRSTETVPCACTKPKSDRSSVPCACSSSPAAPSMSSTISPPSAAVATRSGLRARSATGSPARPARLMVMPNWLPLAETPGTPCSETVSAEALRAVQVRLASLRALMRASANSTPVICRPKAVPSRPALASRWLAPSVSTSASTGVSGSPASTICAVPLCSAKSPVALKKPATSSRPWLTATSCTPASRPSPKVWVPPAASTTVPLASAAVLFQRTLATAAARVTSAPRATSMPPVASSTVPPPPASTSRPTSASVTPASKAPLRSATEALLATMAMAPSAPGWKKKSPWMAMLPPTTACRP